MKGRYRLRKRTTSGWDQNKKAVEIQLELMGIYKIMDIVVKVF